MMSKVIKLTAILLCLATVGLFAGNLWDEANAIADSSSSIVPAFKEIVYTETNGYGVPVIEDSALNLYGETNYGRLTSRYFGDDSLKDLMDSYTDGLIFTPFNSNVSSFEELYSTGTVEKLNGESCEVYYFYLYIDENGFFYMDPMTESGKVMEIEGYVWISLSTGAPLRVENIYSVGSLDIDQNIYFTLENGNNIPEKIVTSGEIEKRSGVYGMLEQSSFQIEETIKDVFTASNYSR
ncbi:MAG: hypothetical protein HQ557_08270 [Bacteroidetes bacterium]|nr:hypothetical protein [Bacteroidota bacterium]